MLERGSAKASHGRMTVAYDGHPYRGFAAQAGTKTVAGTLVAALQRLLGHRVEVRTAEGRGSCFTVVANATEYSASEPTEGGAGIYATARSE